MSETHLKLTYNAAQRRARLEATAAEFRSLTSLPESVKERVLAKIKAEQAAGHIIDAATSFQMIDQFIARLKAPEFAAIADQHAFAITVALGVPNLANDFSVNVNSDGAMEASLDAPVEKIRNVSYHSFAISLRHKLKPLGFTVDQAQLALLYTHACAGVPIVNERLQAAMRRRRSTGEALETATLYFSDTLQALVLQVHDIRPYASTNARQALMASLRAAIEQHPGFTLAEEAIAERLAAAATGIEWVGLGMPLDILVGYRLPALAGAAAGHPAHAPLPPTPAPERYAGHKLLQVDVAADNMSARVSGFKPVWYEQTSLDEKWLLRELKRLGLLTQPSEALTKAAELLRQRADINGLTLVQGAYPKEGAEAFLSAVTTSLDGNGKEAINVRKMRPSAIAKAGEHIASVAYTIAEQAGYDVFGKPLLPTPPALDAFSIGEGIEVREGRHFYAQHDGVITLDAKSISLVRSLVHKGDVNLASGDIDFAGPIVIKGSIDTGASVRSGGDITVEGAIRGGQIYCGGKLNVKAGINGGVGSLIFCRGDMEAAFIENAMVVCLGNLKVGKTILNSTLLVEGDVTVSGPRSVLAGGDLYLWGTLQTHHLGLPSGLLTTVHLGCNWRWARRFVTTNRRLAALNRAMERFQKEWQELRTKPQEQLSGQKKESLLRYQDKIDRLAELITRCQARLPQLKRERPFNEASRALVHGKIQPRCVIYADTRRVKLPENVEGVAILAFVREGLSQVRALDQGNDGIAS